MRAMLSSAGLAGGVPDRTSARGITGRAENAMAHDLATVIDEARRQALVGRDVELAGFDDATAGRVSRRVLFVYGPGGIGKTALLQQIALQARACARTAIMIDGREVDCSPDGVRTALDRAVSKLEGARLRRRPSS